MKTIKFYFALLLLFVFSFNLYAQTGIDTDFWKWVEPKPYHDSVVKVIVDLNVDRDMDGAWDDSNRDGKPEVYQGMGTGTVIYIDKSKIITSKTSGDGYFGYIITAAHVVSNMPMQPKDNIVDIKIEYKNGKRSKNCSIKYISTQYDVAIVYCWIPKGVEAVKIGKNSVKCGDYLEFVGLGGRSTLQNPRRFCGTASLTCDDYKLYCHDTLFVPGDSGGPVFNKDGELVGIINGGWFWWEGVISPSQGRIKTTWPAKSCGLLPIHQLLKKNIKLKGLI